MSYYIERTVLCTHDGGNVVAQTGYVVVRGTNSFISKPLMKFLWLDQAIEVVTKLNMIDQEFFDDYDIVFNPEKRTFKIVKRYMVIFSRTVVEGLSNLDDVVMKAALLLLDDAVDKVMDDISTDHDGAIKEINDPSDRLNVMVLDSTK